MTADILLRAFARLMPRPARSRYLEEWRANLAGASELGLHRRSVIIGALTLLLTLDRDRPEYTGEPRGALPRRLARRGTALFVAAFVIVAGAWLTGGGIVPEPGAASAAAVTALDAVGWILLGIALIAAVIGAILLIAAATTARTWLARAALLAFVLGPAAVTAGAVSPVASPALLLTGVAVLIAGLVCGIIVLGGSTLIALQPRSASRRQRLPMAFAGLTLLLAVVVIGSIDLLFWNPLAKVPGMELSAIYATMAERDGFSFTTHLAWVTVWAGFWSTAGLIVVAAASVGRQSALTPRRLLIILLTLVGAAVFFRFFAGFSAGMSIADSFATSGRDGSFVSALLPFVGQLALAGAAAGLGWAPTVTPLSRLHSGTRLARADAL